MKTKKNLLTVQSLFIISNVLSKISYIALKCKHCNTTSCSEFDDYKNLFSPFLVTRTTQVMDSDSPSTARILIDHGADLNRPDPSVHRTILHDIAERGCIETLNILLEHGANATARDNMGNTPAHLAAREGSRYRTKVKIMITCMNKVID